MNEVKKSLVYQTKTNDVDEQKGVVTVAVNGIGIEDSQHDISMPGSFVETLTKDIGRMRWFLNHDVTQLLGVPLSGSEQDGNLVMVGKLNLEKQIGRDILTDYKLYAENGRTLEHSIGVRALLRDKDDKRKVQKWKMYEYSTLTSWGSNPQTFLVGLKHADDNQVRDAIEFIRTALGTRGYSDERLKTMDMELNLLLKSLEGGTIVTCPECGYQFDYDSVPEQTFSQQALETAADYVQWLTRDIVRQEIGKLTPEIRAEVTALLDTFKGDRKDFTEKSITDLVHYVRCPHCWSRVYKRNLLLNATTPKTEGPAAETKGGEDTQTKNDGEPETVKAERSFPSFLQQMNEIL